MKFLISSLRRASAPLIVIGCFIIFFGAYLLLSYVSSVFAWRLEDSAHRNWKASGRVEVCNAIAARCAGPVPRNAAIYVPTGVYSEADINSMLAREKNEAARTQWLAGLGIKREESQAAQTRLLAELGVELCFMDEKRKGNISCETTPEPISIEQKFLHKMRFLPTVFAVWLTAVVLLFSARIVARENHVGWRRISLISAPSLGALFGAVTWYLGEKEELVTAAVILGSWLGLITPTLAWRAFNYVRAGFPTYQPSKPVSLEVAESSPIALSWKVVGILLLIVLSLGGVVVVAFTATEDTAIAGIQGAVLALVVGFLAKRNRKET